MAVWDIKERYDLARGNNLFSGFFKYFNIRKFK